jgi:hypothetical protein
MDDVTVTAIDLSLAGIADASDGRALTFERVGYRSAAHEAVGRRSRPSSGGHLRALGCAPCTGATSPSRRLLAVRLDPTAVTRRASLPLLCP